MTWVCVRIEAAWVAAARRANARQLGCRDCADRIVYLGLSCRIQLAMAVGRGRTREKAWVCLIALTKRALTKRTPTGRALTERALKTRGNDARKRCGGRKLQDAE